MPRMMTPLLAAAAVLMVSACGYSPADRGLSGAAIGAGSGALLGAATGGSAAAGALIGGAAGAVVGVATHGRDLNLGRPAWRRY